MELLELFRTWNCWNYLGSGIVRTKKWDCRNSKMEFLELESGIVGTI